MDKIRGHRRENERYRVVILGAGFGGLWAIKTLVRYPVDICLIDQNNYHTFFPLLYQVASAELEPEDIAYPVRSIVRKFPNVHFLLGRATKIDLKAQIVETDARAVPYDFLIVAIGSLTHFFNIKGASEHVYPLKTLEQAVDIRNQILTCFERASYETDEDFQKSLLTFVIVGGGSTGVEFAGTLAELIYGHMKRDYRSLDFGKVRVILLEAAGKLLPNLPDRLGNYARERLNRIKVEVRFNSKVSEVGPDEVKLTDGSVIRTYTTVWTAGVRGEPALNSWGLPVNPNGKVTVLNTLQIPDHPNVYAAGDLAYLEEGGHPLPMVAPVAIQQGVAAGENIVRQISGKPQVPFHYNDQGIMAVIGRRAAVAYLYNRFGFTGFPAWIIWLGIHLFRLIGFRNRLLVLTNWAWDYIYYERVVRLILPAKPLSEKHQEKS
ncbi:MAG: NAD(P)/FAD-dependent oxidoreductase [Candidatus Methanoperedens sp.]|nr:NAD(P)/FAD-dependent oxidoreductase [Candidatus Methanoperedens sp.]